MFGVLVITDLVGNTLVCLVIVLYHEMRYAGYLSQLRSNNRCLSLPSGLIFGKGGHVLFLLPVPRGGGGGRVCREGS